MATISGTQSYWQVDLIVTESSTSVTNNTSSATWALWIRRTDTGSFPMAGTPTIKIIISGKTAYSDSKYFNLTGITNSGVKLLEGTVTDIAHNDDGTIKSNTASFTWSGSGFSPSSVSGSGTYSTSTIPRATPAVDVSCGIEDSTSFTLVPYSTSFYHSIKTVYNGTTRYLKQDGTTSTSEVKYKATSPTWTFEAGSSYYATFTGASKTGTITVNTYSGSTLVGSKSGTLTIKATSAHCTPSITGSVVDINETTKNLTGDENVIVRYMSIAQLTSSIRISSANDSYATITSLKANGIAVSDVSTRTFTIYNPTKKTFPIYVKNSRTYSKTTNISASGKLIEYIIPTITITSAKRTEPTTGDAKIEFKGDYFNGSFSSSESNTLTVTWKYKAKSVSSYTTGGTITPTIENNTFTGVINVDGLFDYKTQYDISIVVEDRLNTVESSVAIPRGFPVFWWGEDFLDVLGELRVNGTNIVNKYDTSISSLNSSVSSLNTSVASLNTSVTNLSKVNYGHMMSNFTSKDFDTSYSKVTGFSSYLDYGDGDIYTQPSSNRIRIKNTELVQVGATTGGNGYAGIELIITDSSGDTVWFTQQLVQHGGNKYWHQTFNPEFIKLDSTQTYYLTLWASGYNETFTMNSGFNDNMTRLWALKIK